MVFRRNLVVELNDIAVVTACELIEVAGDDITYCWLYLVYVVLMTKKQNVLDTAYVTVTDNTRNEGLCEAFAIYGVYENFKSFGGTSTSTRSLLPQLSPTSAMSASWSPRHATRWHCAMTMRSSCSSSL